MTHSISEADWRLFRQLHSVALERYCQRVLSEIADLSSDPGKNNHERYLAVFKLIKQRDRELADAFEEPRRSTALRQLACIRSYELLSEEEFNRFSSETRGAIQILLGE